MNRTLSRIAAGVAIAIAASLLALAPSSDASAQGQQIWYRIVNEGRSAGTMARWQPLSRTFSATFPFVDDFQVTLVRQDSVVNALVADGSTRVSTSVSCSGDLPNRAVLRATRAAADQPRHSSTPAPDAATIVVMLRCADSEPPAN